MNTNRINYIFTSTLYLLFFFLLSGCGSVLKPTSVDVNPAQQDTEDICLPPLKTFSFPVGNIRDDQIPPFRDDVLPLGAWERQSKLPNNFNLPRFSNMIISSENSIWITGDINGPPVVIRYDINSDSWEIYDRIGNNKSIVPYILFASTDGSIWGIDVRGETGYVDYDVGVSLLSLYNEKTNQFEFVDDLSHTFENIDSWAVGRRVREDDNGNLYILLDTSSDNREIYRYNPVLKKSDLVLQETQDAWIVDFVITSDNDIWMVDAEGDNFLIRYDMETKELRPYTETFSFRPGDDLIYDKADHIFGQHVLLLDYKERLWVDDRGWLENLGTTSSWHRIIRSPLFVALAYGDSGHPFYYWDRPHDMFQSSDGTIWFTSDAGIIQLNPKTGEWCLFTTYYSQVREDQNHNLWLVADEYLYKLNLEQE